MQVWLLLVQHFITELMLRHNPVFSQIPLREGEGGLRGHHVYLRLPVACYARVRQVPGGQRHVHRGTVGKQKRQGTARTAAAARAATGALRSRRRCPQPVGRWGRR